MHNSIMIIFISISPCHHHPSHKKHILSLFPPHPPMTMNYFIGMKYYSGQVHQQLLQHLQLVGKYNYANRLNDNLRDFLLYLIFIATSASSNPRDEPSTENDARSRKESVVSSPATMRVLNVLRYLYWSPALLRKNNIFL